MKQLTATAIVLARVNYGEADRILTLLTVEHGKISVMAKGVRKEKSRLAGGIELFSTSEIAFIQGKGRGGGSRLDTLVSARLIKHYGEIAKDLQRSMYGYDVLKRVHKQTEDNAEAEYYNLVQLTFEALNSPGISLELIEVWFVLQLLRLQGHMPNFQTDFEGNPLLVDGHFQFDTESMAFVARPSGPYGAGHIKFLRLALLNQPAALQKVQGVTQIATELAPLVRLLQSL